MTDMEKVIKGLRCCSEMSGEHCRKCPYQDECRDCYGIPHLANDALELLEKRCNTLNALKQRCGRWVNRGKDLEAHSMEVFDAWSCSRCRYYIHGNGYPKWKYCPMCGCRMKEADQ